MNGAERVVVVIPSGFTTLPVRARVLRAVMDGWMLHRMRRPEVLALARLWDGEAGRTEPCLIMDEVDAHVVLPGWMDSARVIDVQTRPPGDLVIEWRAVD